MKLVFCWLAVVAFVGVLGCAQYRPIATVYRSSAGDFKTPMDSANTQRPVPPEEFRLSWPVPVVKINRGFQSLGAHHHDGMDLGGAKNTPIRAAHSGTVVYAGRQLHGYGNVVLLEFNNEWATLYAHLNQIKVRTGQKINLGTLVGEMGRTGRASGVHLHFELMHFKQPVDPLPYLNQPGAMASAILTSQKKWN